MTAPTLPLSLVPSCTRSAECVELLTLVHDDCADTGEATVDIEVAIEGIDESTIVEARRIAFRTRRITALAALAHAATLHAVAQSASCVRGVPHLKLLVRIDGESVLALRCPDVALRSLLPTLELLVRGLGARPGVIAIADDAWRAVANAADTTLGVAVKSVRRPRRA